MPTVVTETRINVPLEMCFDMARDITLHCLTAAHTQERAVAGITHGLIGPGDSVTFEGVHFGIRQRLTARVTHYVRPQIFVDEMVKGAFKTLKHIHEFESTSTGTLMRDTIIWTSPLGPLGLLADHLFLERYMRNFLIVRNSKLKEIAESSKENNDDR